MTFESRFFYRTMQLIRVCEELHGACHAFAGQEASATILLDGGNLVWNGGGPVRQ